MMISIPLSIGTHPGMRQRCRFTLFTAFCTLVLMAWGAVVTSMDAGLAVPDWPSSFQSYDPLNPLPGWWKIPPVLAEHGHRLMGMVVGFCTVILTIWTLLQENRRWMKQLAVLALVLVIFQGILGGLRVVFTSLDLAIVHACTAQVFLSLLVAMTLFTSRLWEKETSYEDNNPVAQSRFRWILVAAVVSIFIQIVLGAVLRHYGRGADITLASFHIVWAFVVFALVFVVVLWSRRLVGKGSAINKMAHMLSVLLFFQILLGIGAFTVILRELGMMHSTLQIVLNSTHHVTGTLMMGLMVATALLGLRMRST